MKVDRVRILVAGIVLSLLAGTLVSFAVNSTLTVFAWAALTETPPRTSIAARLRAIDAS
jgi:hypothetical protein